MAKPASNRKQSAKQQGISKSTGSGSWRLSSRTLAFLIVLAIGVVGSITVVQSRAATLNCYQRVWYQGVPANYCVSNIQRMVNSKVGTYMSVDGKFGPVTKSGVIKFQRTQPGLVADGVVGYNTWNALCYATRYNNSDPNMPFLRKNTGCPGA